MSPFDFKNTKRFKIDLTLTILSTNYKNFKLILKISFIFNVDQGLKVVKHFFFVTTHAWGKKASFGPLRPVAA